MNDLLTVLDQFRFYSSQVLVLMFSHWLTMIPFAWFALNELYKLLKRIR